MNRVISKGPNIFPILQARGFGAVDGDSKGRRKEV